MALVYIALPEVFDTTVLLKISLIELFSELVKGGLEIGEEE